MTHIHEHDQPFRPDIKKTEHSGDNDSDATFALDADDPARVDNRNGLNNTEIEPDTLSARNEYSSDPSFAENGMDDEADDDEVIEEIVCQDDNEAESFSLEDQLEAEMDEEDEEIEAELDDEPQRSEGSIN